MGICDDMKRYKDPKSGYGDRLQDIRDWVKSESAAWGMNSPSVLVGNTTDADGDTHWALYNAATDQITINPDLLNNPDAHDPEDVYNSVAHELRHAMQDQYDEGRVASGEDDDPNRDDEDEMDADDRQQDAEDFADAYQDMWDSECSDDEPESAPDGGGLGDWNLPADSGVAYG